MPNLLPFMVTITDSAPLASPEILSSPTALASETPTLDRSATPKFTSTLTLTPTLTPTPTVTGPTPTDTLLPPLEIPTEKINPPVFIAWTGEPTYPGDSEAGRLFRIDYDPDVWAQTRDNFEQVVLARREIEYCTITPWSGRGLPSDAQVEHEFRLLGDVPYDVNTVSMGGVVKFVAYVGGDKRLLTGFQVSFEQQKEECLQDAEAILATLRSFVAEPTLTPLPTPEPIATPTLTPSS